MNTTSLQQIKIFIFDYQQSVVKNRIEQAKSLKHDFKCLLSDFEQFRDEAKDKDPIEAPNFNIFYLLGFTRDEVRTHSKFLAELLKPTGTHGQDFLFLRNFLE